MDARAAGAGPFQVFEHHHDGPLTEHEPAAVALERTRRVRRVVVVILGQRTQQREPDHVHPAGQGVVAARQHHLDLAVLDPSVGLPDRVTGGRARRADADHRPGGTGVLGQLRAGDVLAHGERARGRRAVQVVALAALTRVEDVGELLQLGSRDAAPHRDAALGGIVGSLGNRGGPQRLRPRRDAERRSSVQMARPARVRKVALGIEALDHAGDPDRERAGVEGGDRSHAATTLLERRPGARRVGADRRDGADARDRDAPHAGSATRVSMSCSRSVSSRSAS